MVHSFCIASSLALSLDVASARTSEQSYTDIICPFLSTLVHEKAIPIQDFYEREELTAVARNAGLSEKETISHIHAQFRQVRSNRVDIFNMDGLPNEHHTSSGINDCNTDFTHYSQCPIGPQGSPTQGVRVCETVPCTVPSSTRALGFWDHFDSDKTGYLTAKNLKRLAGSWEPYANDINEDPGVEGTIDDAYTFLMHVFNTGSTRKDSLSYQSFNRIVLSRMYPVGYTFGLGCDKDGVPAQDFPFYSSTPFGIMDTYGRWLSLSGSTGVVMASEKTVWTAEPKDEGYALRASGPSNYEAGYWLKYDSDGYLAGSVDDVTSWQAVQDKDKVLIQAVDCEDGPCRGFLTADAYGNVGVSQAASRDAMFTFIYCSIPLGNSTDLV